MLLAEKGIQVRHNVVEVIMIQCITLQLFNNDSVQSHNYLGQDKPAIQESTFNSYSDVCRP